MPTLKTLVAVAVVVFGAAPAAAEDAAALLNEGRAAHAAARQSIRTLSAGLRVEQTKPKQELLLACRYWRVGTSVRVHQDCAEGNTIDYRVVAGELREVMLPGPKGYDGLPGAAERRAVSDYTTRTNLYQNLLLEISDPDGKARDLDALLAKASGGVVAKRDRLDGEECVSLGLSIANQRGQAHDFTLWLAPSKNYLIRKYACVANASAGQRHEEVVTAWAEPAPGVFVPTAARSDAYDKGRLYHSRRATATDLVVNAPIGSETMALPALPSGSLLHDTIDGVTGKVDSKWRPIGPMKPVAPIVAPPQSPQAAVEYTAQSTTEPRSAGFWVLTASGGLLTLLLAVIAYRRWQARRA